MFEKQKHSSHFSLFQEIMLLNVTYFRILKVSKEIRMKYIIIYIANKGMQARTPQKKKSLQIQHKIQLTNNSCVLNNSTIIQSSNGLGNDGNDQIVNNFSIVSSSSGPHQKEHKEQKGTAQIRNNSIANPNSKVSLVRKYVQQQLQSRNKYQNQYAKEKQKEKQYRQVVISDEFIRSHKLYKMLKQQMAIAEARHGRETNSIKNQLEIQNNQIKAVKQSNHQLKVELWEYKNELMELKTMLNQQEQENKKLVEEYEETCKQGEPEGEDDQDQQQREEEEEEGNIQQAIKDKNCEQQQSNQALDQARIQSNFTLLSNCQSENLNGPQLENVSRINESQGFLQNFISKQSQKIEENSKNQINIQESESKIEQSSQTKIEQL